MFARDAASMAAMVPLWEQAMQISRRMQARLAGSAASPAERVRAYAAMQAMETALMSSAFFGDVPESLVRSTLLAIVPDMLEPSGRD